MFGWLKKLKGSPKPSTESAPRAGPDVPPAYLLQVCQAPDALSAYAAASGDGVIGVLERYPVLMHPQFPETVRGLGKSRDKETAQSFEKLAEVLRASQEVLRKDLPSGYGAIMGRLGIAFAQEQGGDRLVNLGQAIEAFRAAGAAFGGGAGSAESLVNEANIWWSMDDVLRGSAAHIERAAKLYADARAIFGSGPQASECAYNEAQARVKLAERGHEAVTNLQSAIRLYGEAHPGLRDGPKGTACILGIARAEGQLEQLGKS